MEPEKVKEISKHTPSTEESSSAAANLEPEIWEVCAEGLVDLPKLNSLDHYFRQGHDASSMAAPSNNEREVNPESWQECAEGLVDLPKLDSMAALSSNQPEKDQEIISWNDLTWEEILQAVDDKRLFNNEDIPKHTEDHENVERQDNTLDNNIEAVNLQANLEPEHVEQPPSMESLSPSSSANHYFPQGHDTSLMAAPTSNNEREVNPEIWQACAGSLVDIPKLNSLVYYFPQGHMEHVQEEVLLDYPVGYGCCLCRVVNVSFHANQQTDQVFVKFLLEPWITDDNPNPNPSPSPSPSPSPIQMGGNDNDIVSFVKVLSNTDVARHLYVTDPFRKCIFSQLPTSIRQYILVTDINGKIWEITLQSYCTKFTYGWYDFVKIKNLTPGDYIVFMLKKSTNEYFVGIRRAVINIPIRVKDVEDAIEKVRNMKSFEVVYYPILGLPEFVVPKEKVDAALHVHWRREMSVKIAYEDFQCSEPEKRWFYGDILNDVNLEMDGFCPKSSWRILQVRWNVGPDVLKNMPNIQMNMSPWEVEALQPSHEELALSNQELLQACAGSFFDIPKVNSLVYYFPQGHVEHENASRYGSLLCRVVNVSFHADPQIDHVFVKFLLNPSPISIPNPNPNPIQKGNNNDNVVSFVKVLRTSDVTFQLRVTRPLRDCIFTRIPNNAREYIKFIDIHGKIWEIMIEIKSEMPLYCVLSKGWLQFVETKNLKDGDSIVFMLKKSSNEYYVGIRRASVNRVISDNFGLETKSNFEVVYYPILGLPEFVVPKEKVDAQMVSRNSIRIAE